MRCSAPWDWPRGTSAITSLRAACRQGSSRQRTRPSSLRTGVLCRPPNGWCVPIVSDGGPALAVRQCTRPDTITVVDEPARSCYKDFSVCDPCFRAQSSRGRTCVDGFAVRRPNSQDAGPGDVESRETHRSDRNNSDPAGHALSAYVWWFPDWVGASDAGQHAEFQTCYPRRYLDHPRRAGEQSDGSPGSHSCVGRPDPCHAHWRTRCTRVGDGRDRSRPDDIEPADLSDGHDLLPGYLVESHPGRLQPPASSAARRVSHLSPHASLQCPAYL